MATDTATGLSDHMRGVTVTTVSCLAGVIAALVAAVIVGTNPVPETWTRPLLILAVAIFAQFPVLKLVGVDVADFGAKDNLYVVFMTFCLWFITYAVLLTSAVSG
ncbi:MAG: hypothetical protein ABEH61_04460 [Haloarculaceae archaeon]